MKKRIIIVIFLFINIYGALAQLGIWKEIYCNKISNSNLTRIECANEDNCMALINYYGSGTILIRTIDGGQYWKTIYLDTNYQGPFPITPYWEIVYPDTNICYIIGEGGKVIFSSNNGDSWEYVQGGDHTSIEYIMFDKYNGIRLASKNMIYLYKLEWTNDGGKTWDNIKIPTEYKYFTLSRIFLPETSHLILIGNDEENGRCYIHFEKEINKWELIPKKDNVRIIEMYFINKNVGYSIKLRNKGEGDTLCITRDGGRKWEDINVLKNFSSSINTIKFFNEKDGIIFYLERIKRTTDGGKTWDEDIIENYKDSVIIYNTLLNQSNGYFISKNKIFKLFEINNISHQTIDNDSDLEIYPNPLSRNSELYILLKNNEKASIISIYIYNCLGERVFSNTFETSGNYLYKIDLFKEINLSKGLYFIRIMSEKTNYIKNLIIE